MSASTRPLPADAHDLPLRTPTGLFIGGQWLTDGRYIAVEDPASGRILTTVSSASAEQALWAAEQAARAQPAWAATPPRHRGEILRRAFDLMIERRDELALLITLENGKALRDARAEVTYAAEFFRWFAEEAVRLTGTWQTAPEGTSRLVTMPQPIGVALLITPWNFPAAMATRKIGPALAAGCTVILKPAVETPLTALAMAGILTEAGAPPGVVNVIPTDDSRGVVAALLDSPHVRKLSFTGSTEVGRILLRQAADRVLACSMELGGNAPFIVFPDADLDAAAIGALTAKMRNAGEACTAANRFYVHDTVADEFTRRLGAAMAALVVGPGHDERTEVGPLIHQRARTGIHDLVTQALDEGSDLVTGGSVPESPGYFYPPTVLDTVAPDSPLVQQEIFGPVAPVVRFTDEAAVLTWANGSEYGLASYVFTQSLERALRVAEQLEAGMVALNRGLLSNPAAPFGGVKQSGLGREGGQEGIREYTETKYVAL